MSRMKELWFTPKECLICGREFIPQQTKNLFTCSQQCEEETNRVYEDIHNAKEAQNGSRNNGKTIRAS